MASLLSIVIIGGGEFGVTAALELRRRGHAVALLDPGPLPHPDASSTDISKAIRMDYGEEDFYFDMMEEAFAGWEAWNARWPRPLYHQTGMLFLSQQAMAPGGFEYESFVRLLQRNIPVERLDSTRLRQRYPAWSSGLFTDGYFNPRAGWAESGAVVARLIEEARAAGVEFHEGESFAGLEERGGRASGVATVSGGRFPAEAVILAAGAWTPGLLPELERAMWPVGQPVFHFAPGNPQEFTPPGFPVWAAGVHTDGWYGFPAVEEGVVKVANHGPGLRADPRGPRLVPPEEEAHFRAFLQQALPGLAQAPVRRTRLCFYCDTFDGDFWIGRHPQRENLFVCAGGSGHAFKFAPLLGGLIADVVEDRPNRYAGRFAWRVPGSGGTKDAPRK